MIRHCSAGVAGRRLPMRAMLVPNRNVPRITGSTKQRKKTKYNENIFHENLPIIFLVILFTNTHQ